jgi:hypothetical protein
VSPYHSNKQSTAKFAGKLAATSSLAAGLGLLTAAETDAAVVPFTPAGGPVTINPNYTGSSSNWYYSIDIDGDGDYDFWLYDSTYYGDYRIRYSGTEQYDTSFIMHDGSLAAIVAPGGSVGTDTTGWDNDLSLDNFLSTRGYAGVVFEIPGGSPHFGYLDLAMAADRSSLTLYGGAYESQANTPIRAGAVPEPASLALLTGGAAGLAAWRRRNRASQHE